MVLATAALRWLARLRYWLRRDDCVWVTAGPLAGQKGTIVLAVAPGYGYEEVRYRVRLDDGRQRNVQWDHMERLD